MAANYKFHVFHVCNLSFTVDGTVLMSSLRSLYYHERYALIHMQTKAASVCVIY